MIMRLLGPILAAALLLTTVGPAGAHHGLMLWADEVTTIEGFVSEEMDGFPHWEISVRTPDGADWEVDVGSDFEMEQAGMNPQDLTIGTKVVVEGNRPKGKPESTLLRPRRIVAGDKVYEFRGNWN